MSLSVALPLPALLLPALLLFTRSWPILLGTETGSLLEVVLDERQKRESSPKVLIEGHPAKDRRGGGGPGASTSTAAGMPAATAPASTAFTSLYQISLPAGPPSPLGKPCSSTTTPANTPATPHSQLQLWWPLGQTEGLPSRFAWLVGGLVYHGELDWEAVPPPAEERSAAEGMAATGGGGTGGVSGGGEVLSGVATLPVDSNGFEGDGDGGGGAAAADGGSARSLVVTEYHLLLLARDRLRLVNRINGRTVVERAFRSPLTRSVTGEPSREIDGLVRDLVSGTTYMAVDEALYDVTLQHEDRGMWKVYLDMQDWDAALRCCSSQARRDEVHRARAEAALAMGDYRTAGVHFAKVGEEGVFHWSGWVFSCSITDGRPAFEDVALQLAECGDPGALQAFLATRLTTLAAGLGARGGGAAGGAAATLFGGVGGSGGGGGGSLAGPERAQCTLVSAWLTELYLDAINRALLEAGGEAGESYQSAVTALRTHLSDWVHVMDPGVTVSLLGSYGRLDELLQLAQLRGDHEGLLEQLMARPQPGGAVRALAVLRSPSVSRELVYKFAPGLVAAAAGEAVDFFIAQRPPLDPRRLLPALLRYGEPDSPPMARRHVLRYVEFAIEELGATDRLPTLYAATPQLLHPGMALH
ncbi:hypothetical protein VOLCADRAFT_105888 [Volvox carteri f. nagariensis]|uniref:Pep3/Vps18 beta-propeller domain-containing protein n=1 Tax=Volvox carteri f. nagariensis TaxID=3068 RepID=D8U3X2_VOLCA|nr:uncharacterized protein VOLCADRAFT_105888 [Volvox carteri f. nagariensis]EFJ45682.1 hypothetical protein VOLCADRAFT_105888 [Volvox carteri f. nagariensis]|eukprot:XP_002953372.1 hypothetical protein VOLCADRAFT_105888 [Volvox carteri f. nagariensis]